RSKCSRFQVSCVGCFVEPLAFGVQHAPDLHSGWSEGVRMGQESMGATRNPFVDSSLLGADTLAVMGCDQRRLPSEGTSSVKSIILPAFLAPNLVFIIGIHSYLYLFYLIAVDHYFVLFFFCIFF